MDHSWIKAHFQRRLSEVCTEKEGSTWNLPKLRTVYRIHRVLVKVVDPAHSTIVSLPDLLGCVIWEGTPTVWARLLTLGLGLGFVLRVRVRDRVRDWVRAPPQNRHGFS